MSALLYTYTTFYNFNHLCKCHGQRMLYYFPLYFKNFFGGWKIPNLRAQLAFPPLEMISVCLYPGGYSFSHSFTKEPFIYMCNTFLSLWFVLILVVSSFKRKNIFMSMWKYTVAAGRAAKFMTVLYLEGVPITDEEGNTVNCVHAVLCWCSRGVLRVSNV